MPSVMHGKIDVRGEITHVQVDAMTLGDRLVVMKDGWIQQAGTALGICSRPAIRGVVRFIGAPAMNIGSS